MFVNERYEIILDLLKKNRSVTVAELTERFNVSIETIRRDLSYLESRSKLMRVHGGAVVASSKNAEYVELASRLTENSDKKRELSEYAARYANEGDVIAIDSGSTASEFSAVLCKKFKKLTVITYSRDVAEIISDQSSFDLILLGGTYMHEERSYCGFLTVEALGRLHADKFFLCPSAVSLKHGIMTDIKELLSVENMLMNISEVTYAMADSSKFESASPYRLCSITDVEAVVSDSRLDDKLASLYRDKGASIIKGE